MNETEPRFYRKARRVVKPFPATLIRGTFWTRH